MRFFASDLEIDCALERLLYFTTITELPTHLQVGYSGSPGQLLSWRGLIFVGNPGSLRVWGSSGYITSCDYPFDLEPREWVGGCCGLKLQRHDRLPPHDLHRIEDPVAYLDAISAYDRSRS